jgi:hypothetical protein
MPKIFEAIGRLSWPIRAGLGAVGLLIALYVTVLMVAERQLTRLLPDAVAEGIGGRDADRYTVSVGNVRLSPALNGVTVQELEILADTIGTADMAEPALVQSATLRSLRVSGLRLVPLLSGKGVFVSTIEIDGPTVALGITGVDTRTGPAEAAEPAASAPASPVPTAALRRVVIRDGSIDVSRPTEYGTLSSILRGLELELTEIRIDAVTLANPVRALTNSRVSLAFDSVQHVLDDSLYVVTATGLRAESRDSVMEIDKVEFTPTLEAMPFFNRLPERADRMSLSAGPIRIEGLHFAEYVREDALRLRRIDVDSLDLHAYSNIALDWGPRARPCRYHMAFSTIPIPLRIDTIQVNDGFIRYSELAKGSVRPGDLTLEGANGLVTNLTNNPELMTSQTPAVIQMSARLFGKGNVAATIRYPLLSQNLDFDLEASVGPMDVIPANMFATNVTGVEMKQGELDSLWVGLESRAGKATGRVHMRYRDLDFRIVDRNTGDEKAWHSVLGFVGNVALRSSNPGKPGDDPRDGEIDYTCGNNDIVFFEYFVHALVSGLKKIVLIV